LTEARALREPAARGVSNALDIAAVEKSRY
jgi:hypothetical protein